jgi:hypothetical protein
MRFITGEQGIALLDKFNLESRDLWYHLVEVCVFINNNWFRNSSCALEKEQMVFGGYLYFSNAPGEFQKKQ